MTHSYDLIGVGNPLMDFLARVDETFLKNVPGEKGGMVLVGPELIEETLGKIDTGVDKVAGGSAGNTTFAAARAGLRCTFLGKVGKDAVGDLYKKQFSENGGEPDRFKYADVPTGACLSLITPDGERTMRTNLGAAATLSPEEVSPEDFAGCRHAHIEGYLLFNEALLRKVLVCAKEAGCKVSLDLASFEVVGAAKAILPELLQNYVDILIANEDEAAAMLDDPVSLEERANALQKYCPFCVVKAGKDGCFIAKDDTRIHIPAEPGVEVIDTTGAGDFWAAGFLHGWLSSASLEESAQQGNAFGAAAVQVIGANLDDATWAALGVSRHQ